MARRFDAGLDPAARRRFFSARRSDPESARRFDRLTASQKRSIVRTFETPGRRKGQFASEVNAAREENLSRRRKPALVRRAIAHFNLVRAQAGVTAGAQDRPLRDPSLHLLHTVELHAVLKMDWEQLSDHAARRDDQEGDFDTERVNPYWYHR